MANPLLDGKPSKIIIGGHIIHVSFVLFVVNVSSLPEPNKFVVPFIACGDLSQWDSDMSYPIKEVYM